MSEEKKEIKAAAMITVVLKIDMHCDGCVTKIIKWAHRFQGVETVKADRLSNKLTVTGAVDPVKIREKLQNKSKKKVEIISPQPKKENNNNNQKPENANKPKEAAVTTSVLKLSLHCHGCIRRIHKIVTKTKGVYEVSIDKEKDQVTVKGTMDVKALVDTLKKKMKRSTDIVPPKKEKENKNDNANGNGNGNGKEGGSSNKGGGGGGRNNYINNSSYDYYNNKMEMMSKMEHMGQPGSAYGHGYEYGYPVHATELFSEENANGCYIL